MADVKISALPTASVVNNADILVLNQGGTTKTAAKSTVVSGLATTTQLSGLATTAQLAGLAPLVSPNFTGIPIAPTASVGSNTTQIANTAFVKANYATTAQASALATAALSGYATTTQISGFQNSAQVEALASAQIAAITPASIGALSTDAASGFATTSQISGFATTGQLSAFQNSAQVRALASAQISAITPASIGALSTSAASGFATTAQIAGIAVTSQLSGFATTSQISGFTNSTQVQALTTEQLSAITISAGDGLSGGGDISASRTLQLAALTTEAISLGSATEVPTITVDTFGRIASASSATITPDAIGAIGGQRWSASRTYNIGDIVSIDDTGLTLGQLYVSLVDGNYNNLPQNLNGFWDYVRADAKSITSIEIVGSPANQQTLTYQSSNGTFVYNTIDAAWVGAAPLDSPAFTGTPTAPTAAAQTNTTQIATTAFVLSNSGDRYLTTSTTSNTITNGTKTFTVASGLSYTATQDITIVYDVNNHMHGSVTSYSGTTLVVDIVQHSQTSPGPYTQWTINVGGLTNTAGTLLSANNLSDVASPSTSLTNLGGVPTARTISAGTGLSGGGDLTANRTLSLNNTAVVAGNYGSPSQVASFVVDAQGRLTTVVNQAITPAGIGAQPALTTAAPLGIELGGTGATTAIAAMTNLGSLHFAGGWSQTSVVTGTMNATVTPNTFTITATGQLSVDAGNPIAGDIVIFTSQPTATQHNGRDNGPWVVVDPGGVGVQATFVRPDWFSGTVKTGILVTNQFGSTRTGVTYAIQGPNAPTSGDFISVGTDILNVYTAYQRVGNAGTASNTFSSRQTFSASSSSTTVNPITFSTSSPVLLSTRQLGAIEWDNQQLYITASSQFAALNRNAIATATVLINAQTGTSYTPVLADAGKLITASNAAAISLTIPPDATTDFPVGTQFKVLQLNTGQVTVSAVSPGTTVLSGNKGLKTFGQYAVISLIKVAANSWVVDGNAAV